MAFPENFRLRSLSVRHGKVQSLTPLLAQIKGLEHLTIQDYTSLTYLDQAIIDPTSAIISLKDTLRKHGICLGLSAEVSAPRWDTSFCEENTTLQQTCQSPFTTRRQPANVLLSQVDCKFPKPVDSYHIRVPFRVVPGSRLDNISSFHAIEVCAFPRPWTFY